MNRENRRTRPYGQRPLRIAFVTPPWFDVPPQAYGGIELMAGDLIDALVDRGHDVTLVGAGCNGTRAHFLRTFEHAPSRRLGEPMPEIVHTAWAGRYLEGLDVDVIHDHTLAGPLAAPGRKAPTVVTAHGPVTGETGTYYEKISPDVCLVAISDAQRRLGPQIAWGGTVHNAISVAEFTFRPDKDNYVLFLGRFSPDKGAHLAIDAAREAGRPILLAGKLQEPVELAYFRAEIAPRLGEDARFVGEADRWTKQKLAGRAHCLIFPVCWDEPFGMVMIEAMACGTPVVALNRGSVPEVVADGVTGFILDDPAGLPAAIRKAADLDPVACRRHVERNFDVTVMAEGYERVYAQAAASGAPYRAQG
ncbi:MAG TPA: glycosyltransferase family 4 protein [Streptosporangiaceae bacterium]|nr:glycosyltransferase family 4 protein [Streptosporangiaceae bacterium]